MPVTPSIWDLFTYYDPLADIDWPDDSDSDSDSDSAYATYTRLTESEIAELARRLTYD